MKTINRREFVKLTGLLAAGAAISPNLITTAHAAAKQPGGPYPDNFMDIHKKMIKVDLRKRFRRGCAYLARSGYESSLTVGGENSRMRRGSVIGRSSDAAAIEGRGSAVIQGLADTHPLERIA